MTYNQRSFLIFLYRKAFHEFCPGAFTAAECGRL